jgi:hypothetical protein
MLDILAQATALICGVLAMFLVAKKTQIKKWGYIIGMCGQPGWVGTLVYHKQWILVIYAAAITITWGMDIYNYWIKNEHT